MKYPHKIFCSHFHCIEVSKGKKIIMKWRKLRTWKGTIGITKMHLKLCVWKQKKMESTIFVNECLCSWYSTLSYLWIRFWFFCHINIISQWNVVCTNAEQTSTFCHLIMTSANCVFVLRCLNIDSYMYTCVCVFLYKI